MTSGGGVQSACKRKSELRGIGFIWKREGAGGGGGGGSAGLERERGEDSRLTDEGSLRAMWVTETLRVRQRKAAAVIKRRKKKICCEQQIRTSD